jgi:hypothetical protein
LYREWLGDGVYRLDEGVWLDNLFYSLQELEIVNLLDNGQGAASL